MNKRLTRTSLAAALLAALAFPGPAAAAAGAQDAAYKVDEAVRPRCDFSEVPQITDAPSPVFAALEARPDAKAAVVVYGMPGEALRYAKGVRTWLIEVRGVKPERVSALYGGPGEDLRLELWVVPRGASLPFKDASFDYQGLTLFETYRYWSGEYNMCGNGREPALRAFADALKRRPGWGGHIVIRPHRRRRGDERTMDDNVTRRVATRRVAADKIHLVRKYGLPASSIKATVGAADEWTHAELWLVPPGAKNPK